MDLLLYLLIDGGAEFRGPAGTVAVRSPIMLICRTDTPHRIARVTDSGHPGLVCARATLPGPAGTLLLTAFDAPRLIPLDGADPALLHTVGLIASELAQPRCGQPALLHRAGDILFIGMLRELIAHPRPEDSGILGGLADPRLARALVAVHARPHALWNLELLAQEAGMSRTVFAQRFRQVMQVTPGRYVQRMRLAIARHAVDSGHSLKQTARTVGYDSAAALSRALSRERAPASSRNAPGQTGRRTLT